MTLRDAGMWVLDMLFAFSDAISVFYHQVRVGDILDWSLWSVGLYLVIVLSGIFHIIRSKVRWDYPEKKEPDLFWFGQLLFWILFSAAYITVGVLEGYSVCWFVVFGLWCFALTVRFGVALRETFHKPTVDEDPRDL